MDLLKEFQLYIKKEALFRQHDKVLLAVSGGVDSVVLCELCKQAGYEFVIMHCNFQLRGEESERDEQFVRNLGVKYGVEVMVRRFDIEKESLPFPWMKKMGVQEAARKLRYDWFLEVCMKKRLGENYDKPTEGWQVATAQHLNDSIETVLMNFFKGTGIKGLTGILPKHEFRPYLIRPLLFARKEELLTFAKDNNLEFVQDSSNASDKYTRNYFRNQLIPGLQKVFPQVEENLIHNIQRFQEVEELYRQAIDQHKKSLMEVRGYEIYIPVLKLKKAIPLNTIIYEIIREYDFSANQVGDVISLLQSGSGKYVQSHEYRIFRNRNWLIITPDDTTDGLNNIIIEQEKEIGFELGKLRIKKLSTSNHKPQTSNLIAELDASEIEFPLLLRKWKQGDYFYPLGMTKKKKISRFLIDQKLSIPQKEKTWVVEMDKKIIWIAGMRIDNRFKIKDSTKEVLQITLTIPE
jgi:tRNA(Ile)-lysidine synthase